MPLAVLHELDCRHSGSRLQCDAALLSRLMVPGARNNESISEETLERDLEGTREGNTSGFKPLDILILWTRTCRVKFKGLGGCIAAQAHGWDAIQRIRTACSSRMSFSITLALATLSAVPVDMCR